MAGIKINSPHAVAELMSKEDRKNHLLLLGMKGNLDGDKWKVLLDFIFASIDIPKTRFSRLSYRHVGCTGASLAISLDSGTITSGVITEFKEIFDYIPKSVVSMDLDMHYTTFVKFISQTKHFRLEELMKLSDLFDVEPLVMIELAVNQITGRPVKEMDPENKEVRRRS